MKKLFMVFLFVLIPLIVYGEIQTDGIQQDPGATGGLASTDIDTFFELDTIVADEALCKLSGGTFTGQIITDNLGIEFEDSDTNPTCAAGNYNIYADLSETQLKACIDGTAGTVITSNSSLESLSNSGTAESVFRSDGATSGAWDFFLENNAGAPGAGSCNGLGFLLDTTNNIPYFCDTASENWTSFGTLGDAFNQITDGSTACSASGAETFKIYGANGITVANTCGSPDEAKITPAKSFKSITIESPADADNFNLFKAPYALTITDIECIIDPAGTGESVVIDIQERDATADNPATVDATITCDNDGAADDGTLTNGAIDSGDWVSIDIGAVTGTVTQLTVTIVYTID